MSEDRDTRVEALRAGDRVRYLRRWYGITRTQSTTLMKQAAVALSVEDDETGEETTLIFALGFVVAAEALREPA